MQKTRGCRQELVMDPGILAGCQDASMYNILVSTRRKDYITLMVNGVRQECSRLLSCLSPPLVNYASRHSREGDSRFKELFERVRKKKSVETVLAVLLHSTRYVIPYSRRCEPRLTQSQWYGVFMPPPHATTHIINYSYLIELFYKGDLDVGLVWLAIQRQHEVNRAYVDSVTEEPFLWYDCRIGRIVGLPIRDCRGVKLRVSNVAKWCVRVFPSVDARLSHREL